MSSESNNLSPSDVGALLGKLSQILFQWDWLHTDPDTAADDYKAEAGRIVLRLRGANAEADLRTLLLEVFAQRASKAPPPEEVLVLITQAVSVAWQESLLPEAGPQGDERADAASTPGLVDWKANRERERAQIPADAVLPTQGAVYQARADIDVTVLLFYAAAGSATERAKLKAGTRVVIGQHFEPRPIVIAFCPQDSAKYQTTFVPAGDLDSPVFSHYLLQVSTVEFLEHFLPEHD